jgi:hypothetical protein
MKRISLVLFAGIVAYAAVQLGCMDRQPAPVCPVPTELKADEIQTGSFDGVDMLVEVDNSGSMSEEQAILATGFYTLVNSLANPIPGWPYDPVDSIRIAVVTQDMGVSYGEDQSLPSEDETPASLQAYINTGDNGKFQGINATSINVQSGVLKCGEGGAQCPSGWTCEDIDGDTQIGTCQSDNTSVTCPALGASYAETTADAPNASLNAQAACLAQQGTGGCGFEQQLQGAAVALQRDDQQSFMKDSHLLAVILVTDEEDCSMEDAPGLFATDECQDATKLNIACNYGGNDEYLFPTEYFYEVFVDAKQGAGGAGAVIFAAIAGVPWDEEDSSGAAACQGTGDMIGSCLDQDAMQMSTYIDNSSGTDLTKFNPACTRYDGDTLVTSAVPGRRYVELATDYFNANSYVYSICNDDWSPAMENVARLIAAQIGGTCYDKPLDWDAATKTAKCNVVAEFDNTDECPFDLADGAEATTETVETSNGTQTNVYCPLPKIEAEIVCDDNAPEDLTGFGWYYCENTGHEDNEYACKDNIDNDGDGLTDCDDVGDGGDDIGCGGCKNACPDGEGATCLNICPYNVTITEAAKQDLLGAPVTVQCLQQFSFEDGNCQEDSEKACNDGLDNDGNGIFDCMNVEAGEDAHRADPHCCPMIDNGGTCDLDANGDGTDDWTTICTAGGMPDACGRAAEILGCNLP